MVKAEQVALTAQDGVTIAAQWHYDDAAKPRTAIIIAHPTTDWRNHFLLAGLARQGIGALGYCTRFTAREAELILEETLLDTAAAVEFLHAKGYRDVLGMGSSGGAEIFAAYQSEASDPTITGTPLGDPPDITRAKLPPLSGLVFLNPHMGRPFSLTRGLDPSVGGESGNDPLVYDRALDLYNPENGPPFSDAFRQRYEAAQIERNHKITRWCQETIRKIDRIGNPLLKDIPFIVHRTDAALLQRDTSVDPTDRSGRTIWDEEPRVANYTPGPLRGSRTRLRIVTLRSWISQRGLATSHFDVLKHIAKCHVPTVVLCGTAEEGGPSHSRRIYEAAPDREKKLAWIKGATHFMSGQEAQQRETVDLIVSWLGERRLA